ncbi:unnamed protein product [Enterobius vermicularis]|uniref:RNASEK-C17orf49 readthrough (Non-protein coding) n=1 Tax=Enterobius vermicularis TaxID=51028 RepID=A0A0N4VBK5_ENTVE|nr:unnamed protein product [Enterobius vermicularis]
MISLVGNCSEENMAMACSSNDLPIEADDDSDMPELIETEAVLGLSLNEQKSDAGLASSDAFVQELKTKKFSSVEVADSFAAL